MIKKLKFVMHIHIEVSFDPYLLFRLHLRRENPLQIQYIDLDIHIHSKNSVVIFAIIT